MLVADAFVCQLWRLHFANLRPASGRPAAWVFVVYVICVCVWHLKVLRAICSGLQALVLGCK